MSPVLGGAPSTVAYSALCSSCSFSNEFSCLNLPCILDGEYSSYSTAQVQVKGPVLLPYVAASIPPTETDGMTDNNLRIPNLHKQSYGERLCWGLAKSNH